MTYTPIIGLEVHVELKTKSKMFCSCSADYFAKQPNTHTCPICLGLPGALPRANRQAIDWCVMIALSLHCQISQFSKFDRKNYFYPDLAKGFQTSQYDLPFGQNGHITLKNGNMIRIRRVHMEEDTGKLIHENGTSLIDFNRSGVPLVEIVTEPDFHTASDVIEYLQKLRQIIRYLDVSNADMEKGDMRLEPNISLQEKGATSLPGYKVEVKNINSFKFVEKAIQYEISRQETLLSKGQIPVQETRGWNETKHATVSQRIKEEANDYRYFPEPDLPPIRLTKEQISTLDSQVPELQEMKMKRFLSEFSLTLYDATLITREKALADYFEEAVKVGKAHNITPKQIANEIINKKVDYSSVLPATVINTIVEGTKKELIGTDELNQAIELVLKANQKAVEDYKNGKESVIMYLVGQTMRQIGKKIDAQIIKEAILAEML